MQEFEDKYRERERERKDEGEYFVIFGQVMRGGY